jgi:hypothetical protein
MREGGVGRGIRKMGKIGEFDGVTLTGGYDIK